MPPSRAWTRWVSLWPAGSVPGALGTRVGPHALSPMLPQAPMSRIEPDQFINDRYQAIEDRLKVRARAAGRRRRCRRRPA